MKDIADLKLFSERLAWARQEKNMTQQELAEASGVRQSTISALEAGGRKTSHRTKDIAQALGINPAWLANGRGDPFYGGDAANNGALTHTLQYLTMEETEVMNLFRPLDHEGRDAIKKMLRMLQRGDFLPPGSN